MLPEEIAKLRYSASLRENLALFRKIFEKDDILNIRMASTKNGRALCLLYFDGMIQSRSVNDNLLVPLQNAEVPSAEAGEYLVEHILSTDMAKTVTEVSEAVDSILLGDTLVLMDGMAAAVACSTKGYEKRSVEEPDGEQVQRGPREGFTESLTTNSALLRRQLLTADLKLETRQPDRLSRQKLCICYLESRVNPAVLAELKRRLQKVQLDRLPDTHYVEEMIRDGVRSPYKTMGATERPDIAAAKLLEGKIVLLVDGSPVATYLPFLMIEYFQTGEDYYTTYWNGSFARMLRILGFSITVSLPGLYLALVTLHQETIPTRFLLSIAAARQGVPFSSFIEMVLMLLLFEILREAGSMMPGSVGQALSTVGAVVVGQAAVEARIVSAPLVIVVAITGLTAMMTPKLMSPILVLRAFCIVCTGVLGITGYVLATAVVILGLLRKTSFGVPYLTMFAGQTTCKDTYIRAPLPWLQRRK